jgi:RNA polymerase sigma factor (sigma-70 family)
MPRCYFGSKGIRRGPPSAAFFGEARQFGANDSICLVMESDLHPSPQHPPDVAAYLEGDRQTVQTVSSWIEAELAAHGRLGAADRDELRQEVHRKLLDNLRREQFRRESSLRTYVARITRYTAIDRLRRQKPATEVDFELEAARGDDPEQAFARTEDVTLMRQALANSTEDCRRLWTMVFRDRLSYTEMGGGSASPPGP